MLTCAYYHSFVIHLFCAIHDYMCCSHIEETRRYYVYCMFMIATANTDMQQGDAEHFAFHYIWSFAAGLGWGVTLGMHTTLKVGEQTMHLRTSQHENYTLVWVFHAKSY